MTEPIWINLRVIKAFHDRQINEHGGLPGLRDEGLLLSALSRPENAYHYSDPKPDIAELAAAYGFGLAKNHPSSARKMRGRLATNYLSSGGKMRGRLAENNPSSGRKCGVDLRKIIRLLGENAGYTCGK